MTFRGARQRCDPAPNMERRLSVCVRVPPQPEVYAILHRDLKIIGTLPPLTSLRAVATFAVSAIIHQNERT